MFDMSKLECAALRRLIPVPRRAVVHEEGES